MMEEFVDALIDLWPRVAKNWAAVLFLLVLGIALGLGLSLAVNQHVLSEQIAEAAEPAIAEQAGFHRGVFASCTVMLLALRNTSGNSELTVPRIVSDCNEHADILIDQGILVESCQGWNYDVYQGVCE